MDIDNVRGNKILAAKFIKNLFANATNFELDSNYAYFDLDRFHIRISNSNIREIFICENKLLRQNTFIGFTGEDIDRFNNVVEKLSELSSNIKILRYDTMRSREANSLYTVSLESIRKIIEENKATNYTY